jgi:hypothetical protein
MKNGHLMRPLITIHLKRWGGGGVIKYVRAVVYYCLYLGHNWR